MTKEEAARGRYFPGDVDGNQKVSMTERSLYLSKKDAFISGATWHEQNQWIKVEDALPEMDERPSFHEHSIWVLILCNDWWEPGYYDYSLKSWSSVTSVDGEVTHWRYINPPIQ